MIRSSCGFILIVILGIQSAICQDIPVDHYTGTPIINIPVTTVSDRSLTFPVSLFYDASGVKVNSAHGWVGQNWSIYTGQVTRELRGLPDDYYQSGDTRQGWLYNSNAGTIGSHSFPTDGTALACNTATGLEFTFVSGHAGQDTEPDLFRFSAPGISGSFVFDNTGTITGIKLIPYQDVQIIPHRASSSLPIDRFEIITSNGTKYTFDNPEGSARMASKIFGAPEPVYFQRDYLHYNKNVNYYSAWKLSSVQSAMGERIVLHYTYNQFNSGSERKYGLTAATDSTVPTELSSYTISETTGGQLLTSITSPHQIVNFISEGTGMDAMLTRVEVNEVMPTDTSFVRAIHFDYTENWVNYRIFLNKVTVTDNCQAYQPYTFEYDGTSLPVSGSPSQDIWGFYNGNTMTHGYPKLYIYPSQTGINRISLYPKTGMSDEIVIPGETRTGATSTAGILSTIHYPSGAATTLTYEPHQFYNPIINDYSYGGGLRVYSVQIMDGISTLNTILKTYEYKKPDNSCSGKVLTMPTFWQVSSCSEDAGRTVTPWSGLTSLSAEDQWKKTTIRTRNNLNEDADGLSPVVYEYVTELTGTNHGKTTYQFDVPFVFGASSSGDWNPTYVHVARLSFHSSCTSAGLNITSFYQHPFVPQTPYDWARGLLLKTSIYKYGDSDPEKEITNEYSDKSISSATVKGMKFEYMPTDGSGGSYFMYGAYAMATNKLKVLTRTTEKTKSKASSAYLENITDYTYGSDHLLLATTTSTNSEGAQIIHHFKYVKDYGAPQATNSGTDLQVRMLDALYTNGQTGTLVEQTTSSTPSGGSEKTLAGQLVLFDDFGTTPQPVIQPKEYYSLVTTGITSYSASSVSGSGTSRVFNKNSSFKRKSSTQFSVLGDPVRMEGEQRQFQTFHTDNLSGLVVASIKNAEASEVIYSNFDQSTPYEFDLSSSFTVADKGFGSGRNGLCLAGFKSSTASTKYLKKTLTKKPGVKYIFSAWYQSPSISSTHSLDVIIKNTGGTQLLSQTLTFTITTAGVWYYGETTLDLASISDATVNVEIKFSGTYNANFITSARLDEVSFRPVGTEVVRNAYNTAYGLLTVTPPDGRLIENERTPAGQIKYVRDVDRNILQAVTPTTYLANALTNVPISFTFDNSIYKNEAAPFHAFISCLDYTTLEWKTTLASNPTGGSFGSGSEQQSLTFNASGDWLVTLKISHSSYGSYQVTKTVTVLPARLTVEICVYDGPTSIDLCAAGSTVPESESCSGTFSAASFYSTTFSATVTGCSSGTYTYVWQKRPYGDTNGYWETISGETASTCTKSNIQSYDIRCIVTNTTCDATGTSNVKSVLVYKSDPACSDPIAP